jgi:D-alanine-D-alanine ligase
MPDQDRVRLVVLFGGQSAEHEVSCVTAYHVLRAADPSRYALDPIGITREGLWVRSDAAQAALSAGAAELTRSTAPEGGGEALVAVGQEVAPLETITPATVDDLPVVVLPLLHGPKGEDGTVQGLLEVAGVPYVGCGVLASALCMDKLKAKEVFAFHDLPQTPWIGLHERELDEAHARIEKAGLAYPLFVKPSNLGSSVGRSRLGVATARRPPLDQAGGNDGVVVVEEGVTGRELEVAVLGNDEPRASLPGEIVSSRDFYDYEDKYLTGQSEQRIPADLPEDVTTEVRALAVRAFRAARCEGMARVDFFYDEAGRGLVLNEINTIPGFTPISMYPSMWEATGLSYAELVDELVRLALERHERRSRLSTKR